MCVSTEKDIMSGSGGDSRGVEWTATSMVQVQVQFLSITFSPSRATCQALSISDSHICGLVSTGFWHCTCANLTEKPSKDVEHVSIH